MAMAQLANPDCYGAFLLSCIFLPVVFFVVRRIFSAQLKTEGQVAWILSFVSAAVMTLGSSRFVFFSRLAYEQDLLSDPLVNDRLAIWVTSFFAAYLVSDLILGTVYYPSKIDMVTGWIHHFAYIGICIGTIHHQGPGLLMLPAFMELPTVLLALGHLHKPFRNDVLFGLVFFATRILYHTYLIWHVKVHLPEGYYYHVLGAAVLPVHVFWFYKFILQQARRLSAKKQDEVKSQ
ncbi:uncharacterized protein BJ171DRAFT_196330 [Polychytrium aggregatum]|uniref:uncharacterized protein n=1 Tax=Polychytrium aggregatum TaxID=110093 RepID=UPI0022FE464C|nr:uncharacterized protein BJ171DRAFT_196330 [Polychytrium aggregatum]KAI9201832.1 hypothetical protein BJ171DRAFT_196330 [Polychytrium aggregatum]